MTSGNWSHGRFHVSRAAICHSDAGPSARIASMSTRWSWWWRVMSSTRWARSPKRWRCAGQHLVGVEAGDLLQRVEEVAERITAAVAPGDRDVRGDRRQHVVARQQQAVLGHVEAQVARACARASRPRRCPSPARRRGRRRRRCGRARRAGGTAGPAGARSAPARPPARPRSRRRRAARPPARR